MSAFILKRLLTMVWLILGISIVSFFLIHYAPGKPFALEQSLDPRVSPEVLAKLNSQFGLDKPVYIQYLNWLRKIIIFDFGTSFVDDRPVMAKILERIPVTLGVNGVSLVFAIILALLLGIPCALYKNSLFDNITTIITFILFAAPTFWLGLLGMQLFGLNLGWVPLSGVTSLDYEYFSPWQKFVDISWHLFLPILIATIAQAAGLIRYLRESMLEALSQPYMSLAQSKGLTQFQAAFRHALPNACLPLVTLIGLSLPGLLGGSVIFESLFAIPGVGRLFYEAIMSRDYPVIMAEIVLASGLTMIGNFIADCAYAWVDPRVRIGKTRG